MILKRYIKSSILAVVASVATLGSAYAGMTNKANIIDIAEEKGQFSMFLKAVDAAGLGETLENAEGVTVFLPTDDAFEMLPEETLAELLSPESKDRLKDVLSYHVVTDELEAKEIVDDLKGETLLGQQVAFNVEADGAMVNDASVIETDIMGKNGVVHVIDKVLMPNES